MRPICASNAVNLISSDDSECGTCLSLESVACFVVFVVSFSGSVMASLSFSI